MSFDPCRAIQQIVDPNQDGGVNPPISDSSTFAFSTPKLMRAAFTGAPEAAEHFLYARHAGPSQNRLATALAAMEGMEAACVTASGMAAISSVLLQLCRSGDEIIASRTIYGGTYALLKNFFPRLGIRTHFVDMQEPAAVMAHLNKHTRVVYAESLSNPLLRVADIPTLAEMAHNHNALLVIDNTFSPLLLSPARLGADVVVHSLTKFINGMSDAVAGAVCGDTDLVASLTDINEGAAMLLGPTLDQTRAASILKNLHTLPLRMQKHGANAAFLAHSLQALEVPVIYPGLADHPDHQLMCRLMNPGLGFGGMLCLDAGDLVTAESLLTRFSRVGLGHIAVSLGFVQTLFSAPGSGTSSEIPAGERTAMGLSDGLVRMSVGLDHDIEHSFRLMVACLEKENLVPEKCPLPVFA